MVGVGCVYLASDHAGFIHKSAVTGFLSALNLPFVDCGCYDCRVPVDYPDYAFKAVEMIVNCESNFGILVCGTGIGMSIAANRDVRIRAALCHNEEVAKLAREHNNANVLCLGANFVQVEDMKFILQVFFDTEFTGGRHLNRVKKLS